MPLSGHNVTLPTVPTALTAPSPSVVNAAPTEAGTTAPLAAQKSGGVGRGMGWLVWVWRWGWGWGWVLVGAIWVC